MFPGDGFVPWKVLVGGRWAGEPSAPLGAAARESYFSFSRWVGRNGEGAAGKQNKTPEGHVGYVPPPALGGWHAYCRRC